MLERDELKIFELNDKTYPLRCDLVVLEKIQEMVGDILVAEDKLRGYVPRVDADGVIDRSIGNFTVPDITVVVQSLVWMIEEGLTMTGEDGEAPSVTDLKTQDEYTITELALIAFTEFESCISGSKKKRKKQAQKTATNHQTVKR